MESSRDTETGQEASRATPFLGPLVEQGALAAMEDPGTRAAMAEQGAWAARVEQGIQEAMADPGTLATMAEQGARAAKAGPPPRTQPQLPPRPQWLEPHYLPPSK